MDIEIRCEECGTQLDFTEQFHGQFKTLTLVLKCEPCSKCIDKAVDEAKE